MKQIKLAMVCMAVAGFVVGCAPAIFVQNNTGFPVRAVVTTGGRRGVLSPSPGESSATDASEGPYTVTVIPDAEWIEYAKLTRRFLNEQLANSDNLTGQQLLDVIRRLKSIAEQMQQFERAAGRGSSCGGAVTSDGGGIVTISADASGALAVTCK